VGRQQARQQDRSQIGRCKYCRLLGEPQGLTACHVRSRRCLSCLFIPRIKVPMLLHTTQRMGRYVLR
jgi:hypothetical protein